uniref:Fibronectin type III domain-containing protein n=1 Tax=Candidatus Kentrum sp. FM TaxID=2126340 RepID=A0A450TVL0_9GAMM|nr:MAG: Fibronectin type III domain-containing protein [Candidatus Kentron sp. FM]VFJ73040.1 MAG: Fibronectin type III domain-containing protein [Candidatus Kentron sp. FM]VFK20240.1 MAG: Fibronectin type III domain-containing protein [Candidatus Kentron sp. FM]
MAQFPLEEGKVFLLGQRVSAGLKVNSDIYPAPPVNPLDLDAALAAYSADKDAAVAAYAAAEQATVRKQATLQALSDQIKMNLRYAEMITGFDDAKLKAIGWGGRRERTPLAAPGQASNLVSVEQGDDWITLSWKKPKDGGKPSSYEIRRREWGGDADWDTVGTSTSLEVTLTDQERGKELEYGVVSLNRAGEGAISNTVMAVL